MYTITSILRDESSNEVLIVCGRERFKITLHDFELLDLIEGDIVDEDIFSQIVEATERLSCIKKAFDFLSYGDLSEKQLRDKLCRKFPKELSSDISALFVERGYVNDNELAKRYAETFYEFKNMGLNRIRNELFRRGISKDDIDDALASYEDEGQYERIKEFIEKKYDISKMSDIKYRQKVYAGAIRAGFSGSDVSDVIRDFESE